MRYIIVGAGAIGTAIGGRLAQSMCPRMPVLVARGANHDVLARNGLRIQTPDEDITVRVVLAASAADVHLVDDDVLLFATKTQQLSAALEEWVDQPVHDGIGAAMGTAGQLLPAVIVMNGIEGDRAASRYFDRVFSSCIWLPAVVIEPGAVMLPLAPVSGVLLMNRYARVPTTEDELLLRLIADDFGLSSFDVQIVPDIARWKYSKLLGNLSNGVQALVGLDERAGTVSALLRDEAIAVLRDAGIDWASAEEEKARRGHTFTKRPIPGAPTVLGGSSWQSMQRQQGSVETDFLNGEIALIANLHGTTAPLNSAIQRLCRRAALARETPGSMTAATLMNHLQALL